MSKKTIYITEEIANTITQLINPISDLPKDIKNTLRIHKTSLGVHPSFPTEEEMSFDEYITRLHFNEVCDEIKKLDLENYSTEHLQKFTQNLLKKCKEIESNAKTQLENICYNYVINLFQVPEGLVNFECKIVEKVNDSKVNVNDKMEFENIAHKNYLHDMIYKRRMINAIIMGGAMRLSYISKDLIGELYEISPELPSLYRTIITINNYLLFTKNNIDMSEKNKKLSGVSYLTIGSENIKNTLICEGEIFPILLHESIKGFLEMFAAYGLPSSKKDCSYVLSKADFVNAEPWDMRLGPIIWDILIKSFENPSSEKIPLLFTLLFSQSTNKFNYFLQEILGETKLGKKIAQKLLNKVEEDISMSDFNELMHKKQTENNILNELYFTANQL